jgi:hypothetical protein
MSKEKFERADRARKDRADDVREAQDKVDRARDFQSVLSGAGRSKGCCEPCNYHVRTSDGEYKPCKMGHKDSRPDKEICADCSDSHYTPKK